MRLKSAIKITVSNVNRNFFHLKYEQQVQSFTLPLPPSSLKQVWEGGKYTSLIFFSLVTPSRFTTSEIPISPEV